MCSCFFCDFGFVRYGLSVLFNVFAPFIWTLFCRHGAYFSMDEAHSSTTASFHSHMQSHNCVCFHCVLLEGQFCFKACCHHAIFSNNVLLMVIPYLQSQDLDSTYPYTNLWVHKVFFMRLYVCKNLKCNHYIQRKVWSRIIYKSR